MTLAGRQSVSKWPRVVREDHHISISTSVNNGAATVVTEAVDAVELVLVDG